MCPTRVSIQALWQIQEGIEVHAGPYTTSAVSSSCAGPNGEQPSESSSSSLYESKLLQLKKIVTKGRFKVKYLRKQDAIWCALH